MASQAALALADTAVAVALQEQQQHGAQASRSHSKKPRKPRKKRKASYQLRKEEMDALKCQVESLQRQVAMLKARPRRPRDQILHDMNATAVLKDVLLGQQVAYVMARSGSLDLMKPHVMDHRYEDAQGNFCCEHFELVQFVGVQSLKQVFDEAQFFILNIEITISEALGHTTVREDYDSMDGDASICNYRLLSGDPDGVASEANRISLTKYVEKSQHWGGRPCAIMVTDSVDEDELYPYTPSERVRRDICVATILTEQTRKKQKRWKTSAVAAEEEGPVCGEEEELVVVMQRVAFLKVVKPEFEIPTQALHALQEDIVSWGDVMVQTIRGVVNAS
ncbi:hypothetical protein BBJ28_00003214 [Nothophytophthora sp. Chile5]|nr:hypothetical protein BBJ28_00003214 [Nothophytophthora sp. Chile5]